MNYSLTVIMYLIYLPVIVLLTWYVAHILFRSGKVFMLEIFRGKEDIAMSTNRLFKTGFYLLNIGFGLVIMETYHGMESSRQVFEILSTKIGGFSIYLGVMLFFNMYLFFRGRRISKQRTMEQALVTERPK